MPTPEAPPGEPEAPPPAEEPAGQAAEAAEPEYQRRGRGRPRIGETALPAEGFFDQISEVTNWDDNQVWVYRIEPNTDRLAQGKAKFIKIWKEACSEEGIMRTEGSGVYSLLWKRRPQPESPLVPYRKLERLEIENPDFPPRIEPGDWLDTRENQRWAWARKVYDAAVKRAEHANAPPQAMTVQDTIAIVEQALDKKLGQAGPKDDTIISAFNAGIAAVAAASPKGGDSATATLLTMMQAQAEAANKRADQFMQMLLAERVRPAEPAEKPRTVDEEIEHMARISEAAEKLRPRRGGEEHPGWGILKDTLTAATPIIVGLGADAQRRKWAEEDAKKRQQPKPAQQPAGTAAAPQIQQQPQEPAPAPTGEQNVQPPEVLTKHFTDALTWCLRGDAPEDFADWLNAGYPTALNDLRRIGSEVAPWSPEGITPPLEAIMDIAKHTPAVWALIANIPNGEPRLRAFIGGVLAWTPEQEAAAEDESEGSVN